MEKIDFTLSFPNRDISEKEILDDIITIESKINRSMTAEDYKKLGKYGLTTVRRKFGTWNKAKEKAGLNKNIEFNKPNKELFENIKEMWINFGRQPNYSECKKPYSKFHAGTYENRFGSWKKALEAFVDYINQEDNEDRIIENEIEIITQTDNTNGFIIHKTKRDISERMRFRILLRDGFRCLSCGKSPITSPGVELHVDHIIPWSKGGETIPENLKCKCSQCNLGKGNAFDQ